MITDRHGEIAIIGSELATTGALVPLEEDASLSAESWDTLLVTYAVRQSAVMTPEAVRTLLPVGSRLSAFRKWWLVDAKPERRGAGIWLLRATYRGWAGTRPAKIRVGAAADQQSASNCRAPTPTGSPPSAIYPKVQTNENTPTISVTYPVEFMAGVVSKTESVGRALAPPVSVAVAPTIWDLINDYVYHWPHGWVLLSSEEDHLPGTPAALVTDTYKYIRPFTPG